MKVFVLWYRQSSGDYIIGIYDSLEKAENKRKASDYFDRRCMDIEEGDLE
jgi:hypothetical protein